MLGRDHLRLHVCVDAVDLPSLCDHDVCQPLYCIRPHCISLTRPLVSHCLTVSAQLSHCPLCLSWCLSPDCQPHHTVHCVQLYSVYSVQSYSTRGWGLDWLFTLHTISSYFNKRVECVATVQTGLDLISIWWLINIRYFSLSRALPLPTPSPQCKSWCVGAWGWIFLEAGNQLTNLSPDIRVKSRYTEDLTQWLPKYTHT